MNEAAAFGDQITETLEYHATHKPGTAGTSTAWDIGEGDERNDGHCDCDRRCLIGGVSAEGQRQPECRPAQGNQRWGERHDQRFQWR